MTTLRQSFQVEIAYDVHFTRDLLARNNRLLDELLGDKRVLFVVDEGVAAHHPELGATLLRRALVSRYRLAAEPLVVPGGEEAKNPAAGVVERLHAAIDRHRLCRHSFVVAIGGGAVLDAVGYAAATAHRGVRLIRIPTTVLAQNDSGVGVKNGVNAFGKKNFLGTFVPPYAVINDSRFLFTLSDRDWRAGLAEAVKVALIRDPGFFVEIEQRAGALVARDLSSMEEVVRRCAELHMDHIARGGDPFERGSARPLDFGHWAAHKLEQLTCFSLRHGEAVSIGIALDCAYAAIEGWLDRNEALRIVRLLESLGLPTCHPAAGEELFAGLEEFREHLGGELTLLMLSAIGRPFEIHHVDRIRYRRGIAWLRQIESAGEVLRAVV